MRFSLTSIKFPFLLALAAIAGAINVFAFAPYGLWPIQLLTLALLIFCLLRIDRTGVGHIKRSALLGWAYGFGWVAHGVYWIYISLHDFGGLPGWLAVLAVAVLALAMGVYTALCAGLSVWLRQRWSASPLLFALAIFPALWGLTEWLRGWLFTGFPWLISGYAHTSGPLSGYAPLVGVYGLGCISAVIAGCLALLPQRKAPVIAAVLALIAGLGLHQINWTSPHGKPISVRLLQGNVPQEEKFNTAQIINSLRLYVDMIRAVPADLIATPETAVPILQTELPPDFLPALSDFSRQTGSNIALGIPYIDGPYRYSNSVIGLAPQDKAVPAFRYDKQHLVPFGEFVPFGFRWFVDMMHIPLGDFQRGAAVQAPFAVKDQWVLPNICYEDLFGDEIAAQLAATHTAGQPTATLLLNMSNIAWFGNTIALPQHLQISQMRSLESGRPMLRATNTGATAVIDPHGVVSAQLAPYSRNTLAVSVQGYSGMTPYILLGNRTLLAAALLMLALSWWRCRTQRGKPEQKRD
ncbi:Apolipoprotein N-acyltransferase [Collimonas arenae]|uniref:Apolipoprotein N-acyltransferase n=1 Tax=Collimonas arenae TaxID=279058 RepID=A0A0A1FI39_9BURK|nr:apolipoprotein N-acyltransferase [Collimonas arenae]AIY43289.1 Apolipoprotein N-acyltransferase [Collimonas arenae]